MEDVALSAAATTPTDAELRAAYAGRRVLVTGHTGFKGAWLTLWLADLGAKVTGYALAAESPSLFEAARVDERCEHVVADVRDAARVREVIAAARPDYVFHLAAQSLVRESYEHPVETTAVNVMGTTHVLDALRREARPAGVVVVTSDKCYENREWVYGYREDDPMGGHDVYSMSKGATELVVASWRRSFFGSNAGGAASGVALASARAGNVIGGGDWAKDRIVPDAVRALAAGHPVPVRNPRSVRPWQHVLEPLGGYLALGCRLDPTRPAAERAAFAEAWNFGPRSDAACDVGTLADALVAAWGSGSWIDRHDPAAPHEAVLLKLSIDKAEARLGWRPRWGFAETIRRTAEWYRAHHEGKSAAELRALCAAQIRDYLA